MTPWLFTDELKSTQLSRSIAHRPCCAARRGVHAALALHVCSRRLWLIHDVPTAYAGVKYLDVFVMASVVFPTYLLARLRSAGPRHSSQRQAPARSRLSPIPRYIVEENLAYPYAALCLYLIAKALVVRRPLRRSRWGGGSRRRLAVAPLVRGELAVIPLVAPARTALRRLVERLGPRPATPWSLGDWIGVSCSSSARCS